MSCLILEVSDADTWREVNAQGSKRIPRDRWPTVLQPSTEVAEGEAKRLAEANPGRKFMVFAAVAIGTTVKVPTHVNINGEVLFEDTVGTVVDVVRKD